VIMAASSAASDDGARPRLLCELAPPHRIVGCNAAWSSLCGYSEKEAIGKSPAILQGPRTDHQAAADFARVLRSTGRATTELLNKAKDGTYFRHRLTAEKIGNCFIAESRVIQPVDALGDDGNHRPSLADNVIALVCVLAVLLAFVAAFSAPAATPVPPPPPPGAVQKIVNVARGVARHLVPTGAFVGLATLANWDVLLLGSAAVVTGL